ncbi:MAG: glycerol-3-phosphate 1-O-acyltransferase PlsY [Phycisphaerales bacterium]|nr:glycerol-3-phosphate 1-O-acyltransferase PlsY [Phycisphaerales bacterium]
MMWLVYGIGAYLLGSIPFGLLIGKAQGIDIRTVGSGNIGASNLGRVLGKKFFFICFFFDMSKGLAPTLLAGSMMGTLCRLSMDAPDAWGWLLVMVCAVLGHMFSPWIGFKGGKGVATALGAMLGVFPAMTVPAVGAAVVFFVVLMLWRYISMASCMAAGTLPLWTWYYFAQFRTRQMVMLRGDPKWRGLHTDILKGEVHFVGMPFLIVAVALAILVIYKHRSNLSRMVQGTEPQIGSPKPVLESATESTAESAAKTVTIEAKSDPKQTGED